MHPLSPLDVWKCIGAEFFLFDMKKRGLSVQMNPVKLNNEEETYEVAR